MKKKLLLVFAVVALLLVAGVPVVGAQAPSPFLPANVSDVELVQVQCNAGGLIGGWTALQADETAWGYSHNLVTLPQWQTSWPDRMNDIARAHGCGTLIDAWGNPTLIVKTYGPWLELEYAAIYAYYNPSKAVTFRK